MFKNSGSANCCVEVYSSDASELHQPMDWLGICPKASPTLDNKYDIRFNPIYTWIG